MPEIDAIGPAGERTRAVGGLDGALVPHETKSTNDPTAATTHEVAESHLQEPAEGTPPHVVPGAEPAALESPLPGTAGTQACEVELKLLVDADRLADFNDASIIAMNARNKGARKHLRSVYYDTLKRTLWRSGLSLRVRQSGLRFVQTMKAERGDDPLRRGEWEASVPSMAPDLALAMPFIPEKLRSELEGHALEAVFTTDIHRHQRLIELPSGTVEIAFDHGSLTSGHRSLPVSEIELELKGGSPAAIYDLAQRLAEHGPLRPSVRSKAARGFELAADLPPVARRPRKLRLDPAISLDEAFAAILRACFQHLLASLPAAEDGRNPEGVHQLRVSLRRLRSVLDLMRSAGSSSRLDALRSEARWLAQTLSAARDWDIFQTETLPAVARGCPAIGGFDTLADVAEKQRSDAYRKVRVALAERRCTSFVIGLGSLIEARSWRSDVAPENLGQLSEPAVNFAHRILSERHAKVLKRGRHFKSLSAEKRHRLRLALKKLRYVADFLLPLYGERKSARRFSTRLADLQEELGISNDMATTASLLAGLGTESAQSSTAVAAITGWQAHAIASAEARLRNAWCDFAKVEPPWSRDAEA
jgi:triphosphatase